MTIYYVDNAGSNTAPYDTWAKAANRLDTIAAIDAAGDTIYVKSTHSETVAAAVTMAWAGTVADPTRILCVSDSAEPPTTLATGAVVACTGANNMSVATTGYVYVYGIRFKAGDSTNAADIVFTNSTGLQIYEQCAFELAGNNSGSDIVIGTGSVVVWDGCTFKTINAGSRIQPNIARLTMRGGSAESGTLANPLFDAGTGIVLVEGTDLSNLPTGVDLVQGTSGAQDFVIRNCKMPAGWTGTVFQTASTVGVGSRYALYNSAAGDTNYALEVKTEFGAVTHQVGTLVRTGGASDGTTPLSWKMVSGPNAEWKHQTLDSPEIVVRNKTIGSPITVTAHILRDSVTNLTDKEVWIDVQYLGTNGVPLGSIITDSAASYLAAGADQESSGETWDTTGMSNPNKQLLVVSFTPREEGMIHATVRLAKASTTLYVCPKLRVS